MNVESLEIEGNKYEGGKDHLIFQGQGGNHFSFSFFFFVGVKAFPFRLRFLSWPFDLWA